jgi:hypothetical protein
MGLETQYKPRGFGLGRKITPLAFRADAQVVKPGVQNLLGCFRRACAQMAYKKEQDAVTISH